MGKLFTGIRGLMNHVAGWSGREIDRSAVRNDPWDLEWLVAKVKCFEETLTEARQQITDSDLERLRERLPSVATRHVESGGLQASSWSKFVFVLADELHQAEIQLAAYQNWFPAERFVVKIAEVNWPFVGSELDAELDWLATNDGEEAAQQSVAADWPSVVGWDFRPGEAAFQGRPFAITGKPVAILKRLALKPGDPVLKSILRDIIDPDSNAEEGCVRDSITKARAILRKAFKLGNSVDPIPNLAKGMDAAWRLNEQVFPVATKNPR